MVVYKGDVLLARELSTGDISGGGVPRLRYVCCSVKDLREKTIEELL